MRRGRDESGGAISLWVVLMVPVSAFAAVVAMAGPQRLAAESSVQDAADDLAVFAVAWRDGQQEFAGPLHAFPPECSTDGQPTHLDTGIDGHQTQIDNLQLRIDALTPGDPQIQALTQQQQIERASQGPLIAERTDLLESWEAACSLLLQSLYRDLGYLGVDMGSLRGSYSDSLTQSALGGSCSVSPHTTRAACIAAAGTWTPNLQYYLPCRTSEVAAGSAMVVQDAVHVVLAADWQYAGWAAAQVWPDGIPMAAESTGRFSQRAPAPSGVTPPPECGLQLVVLDSQGRPVWAGSDPMPDSRELAQSVRRTTLSG